MPVRVLAAWILMTAVLVGVAAWLFQWSLEKAALLAPVVVATAGATAFIAVLWTKIVWESLRRARHPVVVVVATLAAFALLVVLSFVIELPRYGH